MPKGTFLNLSDDKREKIIEVLVNEFKEKSIQDATVKDIVEKLNIARGSFYQYFESLEESYFYILELKTNELHKTFLELMNEYNDINKVLNEYGTVIANIIFDNSNYMLYKNRYLFWNERINDKWKKYICKNKKIDSLKESDEMIYISVVIHNLISRTYSENWDYKTFLTKYEKYIKWIKRGVCYE